MPRACYKCGKSVSSLSGLTRHLNTCSALRKTDGLAEEEQSVDERFSMIDTAPTVYAEFDETTENMVDNVDVDPMCDGLDLELDSTEYGE